MPFEQHVHVPRILYLISAELDDCAAAAAAAAFGFILATGSRALAATAAAHWRAMRPAAPHSGSVKFFRFDVSSCCLDASGACRCISCDATLSITIFSRLSSGSLSTGQFTAGTHGCLLVLTFVITSTCAPASASYPTRLFTLDMVIEISLHKKC